MSPNNVWQFPSLQECVDRIMLMKSSIMLSGITHKTYCGGTIMSNAQNYPGWRYIWCSSSVCRTKIIPFFPEPYQKGILKQFDGWLKYLLLLIKIDFDGTERSLHALYQIKLFWERVPGRNCFRLPVYYSKVPKLLSSLYLIQLFGRWISTD